MKNSASPARSRTFVLFWLLVTGGVMAASGYYLLPAIRPLARRQALESSPPRAALAPASPSPDAVLTDENTPKSTVGQQAPRRKKERTKDAWRQQGVSVPKATTFQLPVASLEAEETKAKRYDKPDEAAQYYQAKRLPVGSSIVPNDRYLAALQKMEKMPQYATIQGRLLPSRAELRARTEAAQQLEALGTWSALGPGNVGGRTRALLIHPTNPHIMYAAGVSGGVWKTVNGGVVWLPIGDLLPNLAVSVLAMDPKNPEVIYAGTGEGYFNFDGVGGLGIFKTSDGGASWARLPGTEHADFRYINDLVVSPVNSQRLYAATRTGVYRSVNGGASWTRVLNPVSRISPPNIVTGGCLDLVIRTDKATDYLFASCGTFETATVYRNTDAAGVGTWTSVLTETAMGRTSLALASSDQNIVYAAAAGLGAGNYQDSLYAVFRSASNGEAGSWTAQVRNPNAQKLNTVLFSNPLIAFLTECRGESQNFFASQGWYDNVIAVDPVDPNRVWVGGIDLFRSDDGGKNWGLASYWWANGNIAALASQYAHADHHVLVFHPNYNGTTNQTLFTGNDGGLFRTDNARAAVANGAAGPCNPAYSSVTWTSLNNGYSVTQFYHGLPYPDGETFFGGTQDNGTLRGSVAGGVNNWKEILGGDGGPVAIDVTNPNILYASNPGRNIQKSLDGGTTFTRVTDGLSDSYGLFINPFIMDPSDPQRLWSGGAYVWRSTNGAMRWESVGGITPGRGVVSALAVAPTNANYLLVGMTEGEILRTDNSLTFNGNWSYYYPTGGWVSSLAFDPTDANIAYATYSSFGVTHVWRTTNGGVSWTGIDGAGPSRLPDVPAHSIVIDPTDTSRLFVGTDLGVFVSTDRGESWAIENTGFANVATESLAINTVNGVTSLYAFTHGRGVWRVTLGTGICAATLAPASQTLDATGGTVNVSVNSNCTWTAASNAHWITVSSGASGNGNGTANLIIAPNNTNNLRVGTVTIAGKSLTITQNKCDCTISPGSQHFAPSGGTGSISVTTNDGVGWQALSNVNWITINSGTSGTGNGTVTFTVAAHTSPSPRVGTLTIAGQTFTANQLGTGTGCTAIAITPGTATNSSLATSDCRSPIKGNSYYADRYTFTGAAGQAVSIAGSTNSYGSLYLIGPDGGVIASYDVCCTGSPRIPLGNGAIALPANGTYTIEVTSYFTNSTFDYSVTLTTTPGCTYTISSSSQSFSATNGTGSVSVTTGSTCAWQASSNVNWLSITSGSSGTGNGTVNFSVSANTSGLVRSGTLNVAGQTFTVTQSAQSCSVTPITVGQSINGSLSSGDCNSFVRNTSTYYADRYTFTGTAGQWVIIDQLAGNFDSYLYLLSPTGSVLAGSDYPLISHVLPRDGTYTIEVTSWSSFTTGSYTLTLTSRTAGCTYEVTPGTVSASASGGVRTVEVKASSSCQWQTSSSVSWITFEANSGLGSAKVNFSVAANTSSSSRSGTIQIAGQSVTVTQLAAVGSCTATAITPEEPVSGSLSSNDCRSVNGSNYYADRYSFTGTAGQTIAVSAASTGFSPYLSLLGPDGAAVAQGSRLPAGNDFVGLPADGDYIIEVSSSSSFSTGNYTVRLSSCTFDLTSSTQLLPAASGSGTINVTTTGNCAWQASTTESWITINSGASGTGNGTINFTVAANSSTDPRYGRISVAGQIFTLTQTGQNCPATPITFGEIVSGSLTTTDCRSFFRGSSYYADRFTFNGTAGQLILIDQPAGDFDSYLYLRGPDGSYLDGQDFPRIPRSGYLTLPVTGPYLIEITSYAANVTGTYTLRLSGGSSNCNYALSSTHQSFALGGGTGTVGILTNGNCAWQASSSASWVTINSGSNGQGAGIVSFAVAANTGSARTATLSIAGQSFSLSQLGDGSTCTPIPISQGQALSESLSSSDCRSPARGSSYYADRYSFTATAGQAISILANTSFTGSLYLIGPGGTVVAENLCCSPLRLPTESGFVLLPAGGTYIIEVASYYTDGTGSYDLTLNATSDCFYALSPGTQSFAAGSVTGTVNVSAVGGCSWTASSDVPWLTLLSGASGKGDGKISYALAPNLGTAARTGTITVAGQQATITQAGRPSCFVTAIALGQTTNGSLSASDCPSFRAENTLLYADRYTFTGTAGQAVTISLRTTDFDSYLSLIGPNGVVLAEDDDGGEGLNARVPSGGGYFILPQSGEYTIEASSFAPQSTGSYALTLAHGVASVSAASYNIDGVLAPEAIASAFGVNLATTNAQALSLPLPTELDGTTVKVKDSAGVERLASIFYVSPEQVNYQIPAGTALGVASVTITNRHGVASQGTVQIVNVAPGIFSANANGKGLVVGNAYCVKGNDTTTMPLTRYDQAAGRVVAVPIETAGYTRVIIEIFGTGLRLRNKSNPNSVIATIAGVAAKVEYADAQPQFVGLDQINLEVPLTIAQRGEVNVVLTIDGQPANVVTIYLR